MSMGSDVDSTHTPSPKLVGAHSPLWQMMAQSLAVGACLLALMFTVDVCLLLLTGHGSERRDFISYWASGQQLVRHQNPYDGAAILLLERAIGFPPEGQALIVRNPPSALLLVAPLGFVSFRAAALMWSLLLVCCWILSIRILWVMQGRPRRRFDLFGYPVDAGFVPLLFGPALACVLFGQTALFALVGLVLFFRFHRQRPFLAGCSLWLCALKPHLFLPFAAVLLMWVIVTRSYAVLLGTLLTLGASSIAAFYFDPSVWAQYLEMMRKTGIEREFIPCLSIALRFAVNPSAVWLQYVPAILGGVWALWYYWSRRDIWDWFDHGPLLMLVSMLVSPYAWLTDQVLALPALMFAAYQTSRGSLLALALASSAIEVAVLCKMYMHSALYLWTAPAWFAWYLYAVRRKSRVRTLSRPG